MHFLFIFFYIIYFIPYSFLATHLQRPPTSGAMLPQNWLQQPPTAGIQSNQSLQVCQSKLRLQSLQMERERLKQRQQEIIRQVSTIMIGQDKITRHNIFFYILHIFLL